LLPPGALRVRAARPPAPARARRARRADQGRARPGRAVTRRWTARELLDLVLDAGSLESWDAPVDTSGHPDDYRAVLAAAAEKAGTDESVLTGRGTVRGRPVVVVANEFRFLGGSIGRAAAQRIAA